MTTKERVLEILSKHKGEVFSGEKLAQMCGVSRAAVWKAVNALRAQGCSITATTNGGYTWNDEGDAFSQEIFSATFKSLFPGYAENHIECFSEIDSTNSYAKRLLADCGSLRDENGTLTPVGRKMHGSIYVAESQTAGRGRLGRTFVSPAKSGIYLSVVYAPQGGIQNPAKLTAFSAVAVCRAISKLYGIEPSIKWINDIFVDSKKVCGILTEGITNFETGIIEAAVIGIGVNIYSNSDIFPEDVAKVAGGILECSANRSALAAEIAGGVLDVLEEEASRVLAEYKKANFLLGKELTVFPVIGQAGSYNATAVDIDENAGLVVRLSDGSKKTLSCGEVSLHSDSLPGSLADGMGALR